MIFTMQEKDSLRDYSDGCSIGGRDLPTPYLVTQLNGFKYVNLQTGVDFKQQDEMYLVQQLPN